MIYNSLIDLIGNTPLIRLSNFSKQMNLDTSTNIIAKVEKFNPLSSVKDRVGLAMINDAKEKNILNKDTTIIEPTSGNTGIGLAYCAAILGYKLILTMPETMSVERRSLLSALGAKIVLTDGAKGMSGAIEKANEIAKETENSWIPMQFDNPANALVHKNTTGQEIIDATKGQVDIFVAGVGTGGTITGVAKAFKEKGMDVDIVAVEPFNSQVLKGKEHSPHKIQGIGAGFVPSILEVDLIDEIFPVTNEDAINTCKIVAKTEGLLVGISSGAALYAAYKVALREENIGKNVVVLLPDTGERYLSVGLYD